MITNGKASNHIAQMRACILSVLEHYQFPPVEVLTTQVDRITIRGTAGFHEHVQKLTGSGHFNAWEFNRNHGTTADFGYRETCWRCSVQLVHHTSGIWEVDVDHYNPDYGVLPAMQHLFLEVWKPGKTNAYSIRKGLLGRGIDVPLIEESPAVPGGMAGGTDR